MSKLAQRAQKLFIQHLRENNLKVTQERLALLDEIFSTDEHLDADELLAVGRLPNPPGADIGYISDVTFARAELTGTYAR